MVKPKYKSGKGAQKIRHSGRTYRQLQVFKTKSEALSASKKAQKQGLGSVVKERGGYYPFKLYVRRK